MEANTFKSSDTDTYADNPLAQRNTNEYQPAILELRRQTESKFEKANKETNLFAGPTKAKGDTEHLTATQLTKADCPQLYSQSKLKIQSFLL